MEKDEAKSGLAVIKQLVNEGKLDDAIGSINKLLKEKEEPELYNLRAGILLKKSQFELAIKDYDRAIHIDPKSHVLKMNKAYALFRLERTEEAEKELTGAIKISGQVADLYDLRARVRVSLGNYKGSLEDMDTAVNLNPMSKQIREKRRDLLDIVSSTMLSNKSADSLYDNAREYLKSKEPHVALEMIGLAIDIREKPEYYLLRGNIHLEMENTEDAIDDFKKALSIAQKNGKGKTKKEGKEKESKKFKDMDQIYRGIARAHVVMGGTKNAKDAIPYYKKAIAANPDKSSWYMELSSMLIKLGDPDEALKLLHKSALLDSANPFVHVRMGDAYAKKGLFDNAIKQYNKALKLDPVNREAYDRKENVLLARMLNMTVKDLEEGAGMYR